MPDWNVVISLHEQRYEEAWELLEKPGPVSCTHYFKVLVMQVEDINIE